ncbi:MAG: hypothetical protein PHD21_03535 [Flavobacteriales bacterium]|nr:hypothetical protein [Flavobacteriales bacterium]
MKKIIILVCVAALFAACCSVPQTVKDTFAAANPTASDAKWKCDDNGYEVSYVVDGVRYETEYDKNGNVIATDDPQPATACQGNHEGCQKDSTKMCCKDSTKACTGDCKDHQNCGKEGDGCKKECSAVVDTCKKACQKAAK